MRKLALLILFLMSFTTKVNAQTGLVGVTGTAAFSNADIAIAVGAELPVKHFQINLMESFSPYATHTSLGSGIANVANVGGIYWINNFGLQGAVEDSSYSVTQVRKSAIYVLAGITKRAYIGVPARFSAGYIQQVNNGITNGVETSQLHGGYLSFDFRVGCTGRVCFRIQDRVTFGRVLQQGNPNCDGSIGPKTCGDRLTSFGGGFNFSFFVEIPKHADPDALF